MGKFKIKIGDIVFVIVGDYKGLEGKVMCIICEKNKVIVEGVNLVKKYEKLSVVSF